jgi:NADH-quinone oxidoreductase subunit M
VGKFITFPELLIWLPFLAGLITFFIKNEKGAAYTALAGSLLTLGVSIVSLFYTDSKYYTWNVVNYFWLKYIGNSFYVGIDGVGRLLTFLTAVAFPLIILSSIKTAYKHARYFYGLILLAQCGLMGVFCAWDALLFYFFWELALIPVYFLSSLWGGPKRIQATFKFFVYTFLGSLLMLAGIIYIYLHTPGRLFEDGTTSPHSFALKSFMTAGLQAKEQAGLFILFMMAFAIKMPIFPFHTWQPDAYDQSPTPVTMIMSGVMVKMGLFGVIRWLLPVIPGAFGEYAYVIMLLSVIGIVYASVIAMAQDNLKKLVAYSSIAHIGLMSAALFASNALATQGMMFQMFTHGINIIGLWVVLEILERQTGVKTISGLSGIAHQAPRLTIAFIVIAFANIALPLTNAFPGEFMMFAGLFQKNVWLAAFAGLSVILAAVYMLNMLRKVCYGTANEAALTLKDVTGTDLIVLTLIVTMILWMGVFPGSLLHISKLASANLF